MKKKNGFTLIELLAIIVILAIIAVITVPVILNIIENSRKGAATDSAYGYKDSVNKTYIAELQTSNKLKLDGTYTVNSDGSLTPADEETNFGDDRESLDVQVSGTIPSSGELTYSNNVLTGGWLVIGDYRVTFNENGTVTTIKNSGSSSNEQSSGGNDQQVENNSGNEQQDETYTYSYYKYDDDTDEPEYWWPKYIRTNTSSGEKEACAVFTSETVCLKYNSNGYYNNFGIGVYNSDSDYFEYDSYYTVENLTGNLATLRDKFESNDADCIVSEGDGTGAYLECDGDAPEGETVYIFIYDNGNINIQDGAGSTQCYLESGDKSCH